MFFICMKSWDYALHVLCWKFVQRIKESGHSKGACWRAFLNKICSEVEEEVDWAGPVLFLLSTPFFLFHTPQPICFIFWHFWLFLFLFDLFIFSQHIKILKIFFSSFFDFIWFLFDFLFDLYINRYILLFRINRKNM